MITEEEFLEYAKVNDYYVRKKNHNKCRDCKYFEKSNRRGVGSCIHPYYDRGGRYCGDTACVDFDNGSGNERLKVYEDLRRINNERCSKDAIESVCSC